VRASLEPRLVLLDRDDTLSLDRPGYIRSPEDLELYPEAAGALARLAGLGFRLAVVTNQSAVGRGLISPEELQRIHDRLTSELTRAGAPLAGVYHCPHRPEDGCDCRKPKPGLLRQAMAGLGFQPEDTYLIGDAATDIQAGAAAGVTTILIRRGGGDPVGPPPDLAGEGPPPRFVACDLDEAADWIIAREAGSPGAEWQPATTRPAGERQPATRRAGAERGGMAALHLASVSDGLLAADPGLVEKISALIDEVRRLGRTVFVAGNGGSAAIASHFVADLRKGARRPGARQVRAVCLSDNTPSLTAWANDEGYATVFEEQLRDWLEPGDVFVGVSVSGASDNVVRAAAAARAAGCRVVAFTRERTSPLGRIAEITLDFPGLSVEAVEDCQAAVCHAIAIGLRQARP
jgi:histidinol-phosphate phosphatase family protein